MNPLNLEKLEVKIHNCVLVQDILGLFCYNAHMPLFSKTGTDRDFPDIVTKKLAEL